MRNVYIATLFIVVAAFSLYGRRDRSFTHPPMDVFPEWAFPGMKYQPKLVQQVPSDFFSDGRSDRAAPANTVPLEVGITAVPLRLDSIYFTGKDKEGAFSRGFPPFVAVDEKLVARGRDRFTIYCAPCHGSVGDGNGITRKYGMGAVPTYHDDRIRKMAEGEIFNTITNGKGQMNPYGDKLSVRDRWAVIAYVRALQLAQMGRESDVPADHRKELGLQ
jgi:mono/diheme cytochrome c family protein